MELMFILPAKTDDSLRRQQASMLSGKYYVVDEVRKEDSSYERTLAPKGWSSLSSWPEGDDEQEWIFKVFDHKESDK